MGFYAAGNLRTTRTMFQWMMLQLLEVLLDIPWKWRAGLSSNFCKISLYLVVLLFNGGITQLINLADYFQIQRWEDKNHTRIQ